MADSLPAPAGTHHVTKGVRGPEAIEKPAPGYSEEARIAQLEGTVLLTGVVDVDGTTKDMEVTGSLGLGLDEKALEAIRSWRFKPGTENDRIVPTFVTIPVDFVLPAKQTRWHLIRAAFRPTEGVSQPAFLKAPYPGGAGVSRPAVEGASLVMAAGRQATVTLSFDINEQGRPVNFHVEAASEDRWGAEAISIVSEWEFSPGRKNGEAASAPCMLMLVWGDRKITPEVIEQLAKLTNPDWH
jgi:TonB family protein